MISRALLTDLVWKSLFLRLSQALTMPALLDSEMGPKLQEGR